MKEELLPVFSDPGWFGQLKLLDIGASGDEKDDKRTTKTTANVPGHGVTAVTFFSGSKVGLGQDECRKTSVGGLVIVDDLYPASPR